MSVTTFLVTFRSSNSAEGLQQSLDRLSKHCQDQLLFKINPTKTKVIVFQKKSRKSTIDKHNFMVSNEHIEIVDNYTYLKVKFSANRNFTNQENLPEKTKRSFFAANVLLRDQGIYDQSEYSRWDKDSIEKTHIHFCKMCLGLNKRSPNVAQRNELGRLSINLRIAMNVFKFWTHLEKKSPTASLNSA